MKVQACLLVELLKGHHRAVVVVHHWKKWWCLYKEDKDVTSSKQTYFLLELSLVLKDVMNQFIKILKCLMGEVVMNMMVLFAKIKSAERVCMQECMCVICDEHWLGSLCEITTVPCKLKHPADKRKNYFSFQNNTDFANSFISHLCVYHCIYLKWALRRCKTWQVFCFNGVKKICTSTEERTKKKKTDPKQQYFKSTATLKIFQQLTSFKMHTELCYNTKHLQ